MAPVRSVVTTTKISSADFARYVLIAVAIVGLVCLGWKIVDVFLLAFGGIVFSAVLRALANLVSRGLKLSQRWSLAVVILVLLLLFAALVWIFGAQLAQQTEQLQTQLPQAFNTVQERIKDWTGGRVDLGVLKSSGGTSNVFGNAAKIAGIAVGFFGHFAVMFFVGLYLAFDPDLYVRGVVRLFPPKRRSQVRDALELAGEALRKWLVGQLAAMAVIGVMIGTGLSLVGVPLALALGVLSGVLEFIPVVGPIVAFLPGFLLAFSKSPQTGLYAVIVYVLVQQLENHVIIPLIQRWSVALPPAIAVLALVGLGLLFGFLGVLFAMPLTVVSLVLLKKLYVEDGLEKKGSASSSA